jgi:hypothetical protein
VNRFWDWIDTRRVIRRGFLFLAGYVFVGTWQWAMDALDRDLTNEHVLLVTAVMGFVSAFTAAVMKFYSDSRTGNDFPVYTQSRGPYDERNDGSPFDPRY